MPVREWLKGLADAKRHVIGTGLLRAQWRWPVEMPLCRPSRDGSMPHDGSSDPMSYRIYLTGRK